ncbi:MAG TPA: hypothetical protein VGC54_12505 [Planctomycetota bacterium]
MLRLRTSVLLALVFSPTLFAAQDPAQDPFDAVAVAHAAWRAEHGANWRLRPRPATGAGEHLWGGSMAADFRPRSEVEWFELARIALDRAAGMFRIDEASLVPQQVRTLNLAQIGSTDKTVVSFDQVVQGVPVVGGTVNLIFGPEAELLSIDTTGLPDLGALTVTPASSAMAAVSAAHAEYRDLEGRAADLFEAPELVVYPHALGKATAARLAWAVEMRTEGGAGHPSGRRVYVAADSGRSEVLGADQLVHDQDVIGHVDSMATPGVKPDTGSNPETVQAMRFMTVTSPAGNATTDANGDFVIANAGAGSVNVTASYIGPWARVLNSAGSEHSGTAAFTPGTPGTMLLNPNSGAQVTAQANAFDGIIDFRQYIKGIDPSDTRMDFRVTANVNIASSCNAYYNGSSINFYLTGGGCVNTAYSTVVAHEEGHWANDRYGSGNGGDGFGEGNADVFAMYVYDAAIVGRDFCGTGCHIRVGYNTRQFCGDNNRGCYGEVHADGEVLMGALWKVRRNLNTTLGNAAGDLVADTLFVNWMNGYNDGQIRTIIEEHWLVLDDDNGNLDDGTPNFADIDGGFREQGFPGIDLDLIQIDHAALGDTTNEAGPYQVDATIAHLTGGTVTGAEVHYQVDGGTEIVVPMGNTAGNDWSANIPGQVSPAFVDYWLTANDAQGNPGRDPASGSHVFIVGAVTQYYFNDFEGATDEGWFHAWTAVIDDWERATPAGKSTDPGAAFSGTKAWGNDLTSNGSYVSQSKNYLESPAIDLSGATGARLRFKRGLGIEKQNGGDKARILVNGALAWQNPANANLIDEGWVQFDLDISTWADNNPSVKVRFELDADGGVQKGGWTIDDFEILSVGPVQNNDTIALTGPAVANPGDTLTYVYAGAPAAAQVWLARSFSLNGASFFGHSFELGLPIALVASGTADAAGAGSWILGPVPSSASGLTIHLEVAAKKGAEVADSNPLTLTIN